MEQFSISRIHTNMGIFRISGLLVNSQTNTQITYEFVEFMGTDGWCELDWKSSKGRDILSQIESEVILHLSLRG
jgi:hypothetical protein